jgi:hypothetical protein
MCIGTFSESSEKFLYEKPRFKELNLENLMTNDLHVVLTSQERYYFVYSISNLVVENMTKNTTLLREP